MDLGRQFLFNRNTSIKMVIIKQLFNLNSLKTVLTICLIVTCAISGKAQRNANYPPDLKQLHGNILADILQGTSDKDNVKKIMEQLSDQGAWPDIDYASKQR